VIATYAPAGTLQTGDELVKRLAVAIVPAAERDREPDYYAGVIVGVTARCEQN
jgi:hypothetical protein